MKNIPSLRRIRLFILVNATLSLALALPSKASVGVFGNGSFSNASDSKYGNVSRSSVSSQSSSNLSGVVGSLQVGAGVAQTVSNKNRVLESNLQNTIGLGLASYAASFFSVNTGATLGVALYDTAAGKQYSLRRLYIPVGMRMHFTRALSLGAAAIGAFPMGERTETGLQAPNIGVQGSLGYLIPATKDIDWMLQLNYEKGLFHLGDAGPSGASIRNISGVAGVAAKL